MALAGVHVNCACMLVKHRRRNQGELSPGALAAAVAAFTAFLEYNGACVMLNSVIYDEIGWPFYCWHINARGKEGDMRINPENVCARINTIVSRDHAAAKYNGRFAIPVSWLLVVSSRGRWRGIREENVEAARFLRLAPTQK